MAEQYQLTQEAFDRIKAEHEDLTTRWRIDIARKIEAARELGDLKENGDYHAAKDEQGQVESRIGHLGALIEGALIIETSNADEISVGVLFDMRYAGDDDAERYVVGSIEERMPGVTVISPTSPLGEAVVGSKAGDKVNYEAPGGTLEVEIVSVGA